MNKIYPVLLSDEELEIQLKKSERVEHGITRYDPELWAEKVTREVNKNTLMG